MSRIPSVTLADFADDIERGSVDFSVAWGRNGSATEAFRPYKTDAEAKHYRDALAITLRGLGVEVRRSTLRHQRREWWAMGVTCDLVCAVYTVEIISTHGAMGESPASLAA